MKKIFLETSILFILANWFRIIVVILMIMIYSQLTNIETDLYGGEGKTGISGEVVKETNLTLDDLDRMQKDLQYIEENTCRGSNCYIH